MKPGSIHPISSLIREANRIFFDMGFSFAEGPLLESERYNFDMLNFPKDHPSRDMQDTFFIKGEQGNVLRTHTSNVQTRYMESQMKKGVPPPYRVVSLGKVFRNESSDMGHESEFFQIEALAIDRDVTMANLKDTLQAFFRGIYGGTSVEGRFRPSFFPFTDPSVEVDMRVSGAHIPEKLRDKWMEMGGAGMVHPNVLKNTGVDPEKYQGFAFGFGIDRLAMLKWGIDDIRLMHSADLRFINQF